ncbi:MAG TPA: glutamyl-tRNA reductase [Firmicutes bacterium]|nr:glutamyl-tRNA reductase [Bacillota bacterium]
MAAVVGLSHRTAPLAIRERVSPPSWAWPEILRDLAREPAVGEVALLVTCNRTEIYLVPPARVKVGLDFFLAHDRVAPDHLYVLEDARCTRHLFRVATGLDSPVLGETQVVGQVRQALAVAQSAGTAGADLAALLSAAVAAARRVHRETELGRYATSASEVAVKTAAALLGGLEDKPVLLLGAGKMCELAARALRGRGGRVFVCSRTTSHAAALVSRYGGELLPWGDLGRGLAMARLLICATAAPGVVLEDRMLREALAPERPVVVCDLGVPRNVDPRVADLPGVVLLDLDRFQAAALPPAEISARAEALLEEEVQKFEERLGARRVASVIRELRERYHGMARAESLRALAAMGDLAPEQRRAVEEMARRIANKALHGPTRALRRWAAAGADGGRYVEVLREALLARGSREVGAEEPREGQPGEER